MTNWNPWHGCMKISQGCNYCNVYSRDAEFGKDASKIHKTAMFDLPLQKNRKKEYKILPQEEPVYVCMTSDFFIKDADEWRDEAWMIMRERQDLHFVILTKRMHRVQASLPKDWGKGYENVTIACSVENQSRADDRLSKLLELPSCHKEIVIEPMLEQIDIEGYLNSGQIERVICAGEVGVHARGCNYAWVLDMMNQCMRHDVTFEFRRTGSLFQKGDKIYHIKPEEQEVQAQKSGVNFDRDFNCRKK